MKRSRLARNGYDGGYSRSRAHYGSRYGFVGPFGVDASSYDWDFRPLLSYAGTTLTITCANKGVVLATAELDEEQDEALQRDRLAELRVKFQVHGMHGRLKDIHPIIADGKAKKLATANWKTTQLRQV